MGVGVGFQPERFFKRGKRLVVIPEKDPLGADSPQVVSIVRLKLLGFLERFQGLAVASLLFSQVAEANPGVGVVRLRLEYFLKSGRGSFISSGNLLRAAAS